MNTTLRENIDWVGVVDWTIRDFHSYETERGATYNAYLVRDEKTALVDTVKAPFAGELLRNVASLCDPSRVDFIVCNHAELDHAGALAASDPRHARRHAAVRQEMRRHAGRALRYVGLADSGRRKRRVDSLGRRTLQFFETPMVHWPESMCTYVPEEKLLFSMDAFGQHYATSERFDDEADLPAVMDEAKTYYANIVMPYGKAVLKTLERLAGLEIGMIAPSHGLIWRRHVAEIVAAYRAWANHRSWPKVLVIYDTMWESTAAMARAILDGAAQPGVSASLIHVRRTTSRGLPLKCLMRRPWRSAPRRSTAA